MKALLFVEIDGKKYFKCDTFWSQSFNPEHAKIYSDDSSQLKGWLQSAIHGYIYKSKDKTLEGSIEEWKIWIKKHEGAKLGYLPISNQDLFKNAFSLKEGTKVEDLNKPVYLWMIRLKDESEWTLKSSDEKSADYDLYTVRYFDEYKQFHRDEIIGELLN
jgi:hypothetical protein